MNDDQPEEPKPIVEISAVSYEHMKVTVDGKPAKLAVVTDDGKIVAVGQQVAIEVRAVAVNNYRNFLKEKGWLRVNSVPKD